ncbi:hypothetical protein JCM8547_004496 [Rhodosporidiobolus lusitaniae]
MLSSSPGPHQATLRTAAAFHGAPIAAPSSPSAAYPQDGEISPSFDASFASSMSITSDERPAPSPLPSHLRPGAPESSPVAMDISPAPQPQPSFLSREVFGESSSSNPPLFGRPLSGPPAASSSSSRAASSSKDHPFLKSLFRAQQSAPATQTTFAPIAPLSLPRSASPDELHPAPVASTSAQVHRPSLAHYATVPPAQADKLRCAPLEPNSFLFRANSTGVDTTSTLSLNDDVKGKATAPLRLSGSSRSRSALPSSWSKSGRNSPTMGALLPPPMPPPKRRSDPTLPTVRSGIESSPFRMDIDGASPNGKLASPISLRQPRSVSDSRVRSGGAHPFSISNGPNSSPYSDENDRSGADDRLADMFGQSPGDLSPIPQSRKRLLELENSPTPASPTPPSGLVGGSLGATSRRAFEKAASTATLGKQIRRQRSAVGLSLNRRPSLATFASLGPAAAAIMQSEAASSSSVKRHAAQAQDGKPVPAARRASRRSNSVADASFTYSSCSSGGSSSSTGAPLSTRDPNVPMESPRTLAARASIATLDGCVDYFNASASRRGGASVDLSCAGAAMSPENSGSPIAGFRKQEAKGKTLPCFNVKEDGLMRISPETLNELQSGRYRDGVKEFLIIDCRFDYEYDGGHIDGAINLSEHADIEAKLLSNEAPEPSTSERCPRDGKTLLIFHCEFSAKRAPTSAKYLRNQDRLKNFAAYPNIHYPEVYVLQGGYEAFYKAFPERCVGGYVVMDHPEHDAKRSVNLNRFREQKRQFSRASSFTYGQAQHATSLLRANEAAGSTSSTQNYSRSNRSRKPLEPPGFQFPLGGASKKTGSSFLAPPASATVMMAASTAQLSITEEDHEGDSSFGTNGSSPGGPSGGSPCPPSSKLGRHSLKLGSGGGAFYPRKMGLERAATASVLPFARM